MSKKTKGRRKVSLAASYKALNKAKDLFEKDILYAIETEAIRLNLTEIKLLTWSDVYLRGEEEVEAPKKIDYLLRVYYDNINPQGIQALWNHKNGWT
jgi:hypothetical protein